MISKQEVLAIARLARLELESDEAERIGAELNSILDHMAELADAEVPDAAAAELSTAPVGAPASDRADGPLTDSPTSEPVPGGVAAIAPDSREGFIVVPRLSSHVDVGEPSDPA